MISFLFVQQYQIVSLNMYMYAWVIQGNIDSRFLSFTRLVFMSHFVVELSILCSRILNSTAYRMLIMTTI